MPRATCPAGRAAMAGRARLPGSWGGPKMRLPLPEDSTMRGLATLLALSLGFVGCITGADREEEDLGELARAGEYRVLGVVNVDTLAVDLDRNGAWAGDDSETVRLLGIRGPSYDEQSGIYEYPAAEAVAWLQQLVGQVVLLDDDRREEGIYRQDPPPDFAVTEDYRQLSQGGPWLAYCYVGDVMVNRELLELGYAWVRDPNEVPCNRLPELRQAEERAQRKGIGVWEFRKKS